jgi:hypothetical protein
LEEGRVRGWGGKSERGGRKREGNLGRERRPQGVPASLTCFNIRCRDWELLAFFKIGWRVRGAEQPWCRHLGSLRGEGREAGGREKGRKGERKEGRKEGMKEGRKEERKG